MYRPLHDDTDILAVFPLEKTLSLILTNKTYRKEILPISTMPGLVPARFSSSNILLTVYFDEFEVANPIGAYKKKHKLGGVYFSIANLNPQHRSKLAGIHPLALIKMANSDDDLFKSLVEVMVGELNSVASFQCEDQQFKANVFAVIGDCLLYTSPSPRD